MSQSTTSLFRRLAWQSSVTLEIRFAEDGPGGGGVPEVYYVSRQRAIADTENGEHGAGLGWRIVEERKANANR